MSRLTEPTLPAQQSIISQLLEFAQVDWAATATTPISIDFDANRLALLKRAKFQGPSYQKFTDELWLYARAVLLSKLRSGLIFAWCAEGRCRRQPDLRRT